MTAVAASAFVILNLFITGCTAVPTFSISYDHDTFLMNGEPFRYISGSIHYQRVPYQYWDDRLKKMAAAGLNAIQTYVAWNGHEMSPGVYDFTGQQDVAKFLQTAQKYNLSVILRPGPYICAEWEFGGFPGWLMNYDNITLRSMDKNYIQAVDKWMTKLYTVVKPYLFKYNGPIITVQIENEYGSYFACDYKYLEYLRDKAIQMLGDDVVLFTTDGDGDGYLKCGTVNGTYATVDFGISDDPKKNFDVQRHKEPHGPLVNSEYYTGWLDHWGEPHSTTDKNSVASSLDKMLSLGANVNMYMFEGGTNFAFWNGANYPYGPVPTSYDYDAPLTEAGDITPKYMMIRNITAKYKPLPDIPIPPNTVKKAYGKIMLSFIETVQSYVEGSSSKTSEYPVNMEKMNHYYGFILYETILKQDVTGGKLDLSGVRDRAYISIGPKGSQKSIGVVERETKTTVLDISGKEGDMLSILVENQGRINYGSQINNNKKGLISNVTLDGKILTNWVNIPVQVDKISKHVRSRSWLRFIQEGVYTLPGIYKGQLNITGQPEDTYLDMSKWTKGQLFINGQNMGRYWPNKGPQVRLYIPKFSLQQGLNDVILLELEGSPCSVQASCYIEFMDTPLINANVTFVDQEDNSESEGILVWLLGVVVQIWQYILYSV